jgi:TolA-binding protein
MKKMRKRFVAVLSLFGLSSVSGALLAPQSNAGTEQAQSKVEAMHKVSKNEAEKKYRNSELENQHIQQQMELKAQKNQMEKKFRNTQAEDKTSALQAELKAQKNESNNKVYKAHKQTVSNTPAVNKPQTAATKQGTIRH